MTDDADAELPFGLPLQTGDPFTEPSEADFNFSKSSCLIPARACAFAYLDDNGDLRIWSDDYRHQCTSELRIDRDDIHEFIDGLLALVGPTARSNAEKCRAYRQRKRKRDTSDTTSDTTRDTGDTR